MFGHDEVTTMGRCKTKGGAKIGPKRKGTVVKSTGVQGDYTATVTTPATAPPVSPPSEAPAISCARVLITPQITPQAEAESTGTPGKDVMGRLKTLALDAQIRRFGLAAYFLDVLRSGMAEEVISLRPYAYGRFQKNVRDIFRAASICKSEGRLYDGAIN
jgi:hypothetical protein